MSVYKPIYYKKAFTKMLLDKIQNLETGASTMYNVASTKDMVELDKYRPQRVNQTVQK